jgi:hypothetical protein
MIKIIPPSIETDLFKYTENNKKNSFELLDCPHKTSPPIHIPISEEVHEKLNTP